MTKKKKYEVEMFSYGIYDGWDSKSKNIPTVKKFTTIIPTLVGIEFGYVLKIRKARGAKLSFCIDHPPFKDSSGKIAPPFRGDVFIRDNDFEFFIGDTIWEPVNDKQGAWRITCELDEHQVADKTFTMVSKKEDSPSEADIKN